MGKHNFMTKTIRSITTRHYFEPKQKAEKFYQVCNLFVTLFLIVYILLRVK
jgi:hypothetical protein